MTTPPDDRPPLPARVERTPLERAPLERAALERVLARAAELAASESDPSESTLTEEQLVEVGKEVGLAPQHIRQALAEERTRVIVPAEAGAMARVFGPATASASRTIKGTQESVFASLDQWMQHEECLQVKRLFPDRMTWEARQGFFTDIKRFLNVGGRGYHLSRAHEVAATVVPVDSERVLVGLEASMANIRTQRIALGGAATGGGALATGTLLALGIMTGVAVVPVAVGVAGGLILARSHTPMVSRAQLALEQVLDRLERGDMPRRPPLLAQALGAARLIR